MLQERKLLEELLAIEPYESYSLYIYKSYSHPIYSGSFWHLFGGGVGFVALFVCRFVTLFLLSK